MGSAEPVIPKSPASMKETKMKDLETAVGNMHGGERG